MAKNNWQDKIEVGKAQSGDSKFATFTRSHEAMDKILTVMEQSEDFKTIGGVPVREAYNVKKVVIDKAIVGLALMQLGLDEDSVAEIVTSKTFAKDSATKE